MANFIGIDIIWITETRCSFSNMQYKIHDYSILLHSNHDGDKLYEPVVSIPLHLFQILEECLIKAHVVLFRRCFLPWVSPDDFFTILDHHCIQISGSMSGDERGSSRERPTDAVVTEHGSIDSCASWRPPEHPIPLGRMHLAENSIGDSGGIHAEIVH